MASTQKNLMHQPSHECWIYGLPTPMDRALANIVEASGWTSQLIPHSQALEGWDGNPRLIFCSIPVPDEILARKAALSDVLLAGISGFSRNYSTEARAEPDLTLPLGFKSADVTGLLNRAINERNSDAPRMPRPQLTANHPTVPRAWIFSLPPLSLWLLVTSLFLLALSITLFLLWFA